MPQNELNYSLADNQQIGKTQHSQRITNKKYSAVEVPA